MKDIYTERTIKISIDVHVVYKIILSVYIMLA